MPGQGQGAGTYFYQAAAAADVADQRATLPTIHMNLCRGIQNQVCAGLCSLAIEAELTICRFHDKGGRHLIIEHTHAQLHQTFIQAYFAAEPGEIKRCAVSAYIIVKDEGALVAQVAGQLIKRIGRACGQVQFSTGFDADRRCCGEHTYGIPAQGQGAPLHRQCAIKDTAGSSQCLCAAPLLHQVQVAEHLAMESIVPRRVNRQRAPLCPDGARHGRSTAPFYAISYTAGENPRAPPKTGGRLQARNRGVFRIDTQPKVGRVGIGLSQVHHRPGGCLLSPQNQEQGAHGITWFSCVTFQHNGALEIAGNSILTTQVDHRANL